MTKLPSSSSVPEIDADIREDIVKRLENIQADHDITILFAIESGSRAWGFPSPDSDYDVRFVYAHPVEWYLSIAPGRDVIELPIEGDLDINGWDIKKALGLLIKPNPVLLEWLSSPIRYIWDQKACSLIKALADRAGHGTACLNHYLSLGSRQWNSYLSGKTEINLKKYLYVIRPAMAIRWIRMFPDVTPPMNFHELKRDIGLSSALTLELDRILKKKSRSKELGSADRIAVIDDFITSEFEWAAEATSGATEDNSDLQHDADVLFRSILGC